MTKTILIMALAATLILCTFTMATDAFGLVFDEPGTYAIKTNRGTAICTVQEESCGLGTAKTRFQLLVTNVEGVLSTGVARGQIIFQGAGEVDGIVQNDGPLSFTYDTQNRVLEMTGKFVHSDGAKYAYDAVGNIVAQKEDKTKIKFDSFMLTNQDNYNVISIQELKGRITETTPVLIQPGDPLFLKGTGPILCESGVECGTAKTQIDMEVETVSQFGYDAVGNRVLLNLKFNDGETKLTLSNQEPLSYTYDDVGNILQSEPVGLYDANDNQFTVIQSYTYDDVGNQKTKVKGIINLLTPNGTGFNIPIIGSIKLGFILEDVFSPGLEED